MIIRCANCGQEHYTRPIIDTEENLMIWQWRAVRLDGCYEPRLLERLSKSFCGHVCHGQLIEALWPDPDLEPDWVDSNLRQYIYRVRPKIIRLGLEIKATWSFGYELRPVQPVLSLSARRFSPAEQTRCLEFA